MTAAELLAVCSVCRYVTIWCGERLIYIKRVHDITKREFELLRRWRVISYYCSLDYLSIDVKYVRRKGD